MTRRAWWLLAGGGYAIGSVVALGPLGGFLAGVVVLALLAHSVTR